MQKNITLAHGNGGQENNELIEKIFYKYFKNDILEKSEDSALLNMESSQITFSTDSFTVNPLFFPGGDIGKLSICGTCNDLAMMGAKPKYLTCSFIIEEGMNLRELEKIVRSMKKELEINEAKIVSGDTKVVPKGSVDKLFINTSGIGEIIYSGISAHNLKEDMAILVSRDIGTHGAVIFASREGISLDSNLTTDSASLFPQVKTLFDANLEIKALRDATRGGVAAVLNEWAKASNVCIEIEEEAVPIQDEVKGICELLGFEALNLANEGTFVVAVPKEQAEKALKILKQNNSNAQIIGEVTNQYPQKVILNSSWGTKRFLDMPSGELLPRIC
jgi:hydrogenase expression/formation protein HypE